MAILAGTQRATLNTRAAFLEVVNDALGSVAFLVAAAVIATAEWLRADAVVSILIELIRKRTRGARLPEGAATPGAPRSWD